MYGFLSPNRQSLSKENAKTFKKFYCGQCCASQKYFGYASRTLVSYDATFIGLLLAAQNSQWKQETKGWCAVFPYKQKIYSPDDLPQIVSACVSILLKEIKIKDALQEKESRFKRFSHRFWFKKINKAKQIFKSIGFPIDSLIEKTLESQKNLENKTNRQFTDYAIPSATFIAELFRATAILSGLKENESILYDIGYHVGKIIYIVDSCIDIKEDFEKDQFNALIAADFDDYFIENRFKNLLHSTMVESFVKVRDSIRQLRLFEHQEVVENIILHGFPNKISERIDHKKEIVGSLKISKLKLVSETALASAICFLLESNAEAGFAWGEVILFKEKQYQYGCSICCEGFTCFDLIFNPCVYYAQKNGSTCDWCGFIICQAPKAIISLSGMTFLIHEIFKRTRWSLWLKHRWNSKLVKSDLLFQKGSKENYQIIIKLLNKYKHIEKTKNVAIDLCRKAELSIEILSAIEKEEYSHAFTIVQKNTSYDLSNMKEFREIFLQSEEYYKQAEKMFIQGGNNNYQCIVDLLTTYNGIKKFDELIELAIKAKALLHAIDSKKYSRAYEIKNNKNPRLSYRLSIMKEFIAIKHEWNKNIAKTEELFPSGGTEIYQQINTLMRPFHDIQELENKPEWWSQRVEKAIKIIELIENKQYKQVYQLVHDNLELKLIEVIEFESLQSKWQTNLSKTEALFPKGGKENYQKIENLMRPFHGIQELTTSEWWTKRVENSAKIITFIENKQYGDAYLLVHNNPEFNLIETLEFKKIQKYREKVITKCETFLKKGNKDNYQKIIQLMKSFLGSPKYDGKPEWWTERSKFGINICNFIQTKEYGKIYSILIENDQTYLLRDLPEIISIMQSYQPFMVQAQNLTPFNFLMLKMWHFSHANPLSMQDFQDALEAYGNKHFFYDDEYKRKNIQTIDALLAQAMVHQRAKAGTLQTLNQPLQDWINKFCNKKNISECTRLCNGLKELKCFDLERKLLESMVASYIATDAQVKRLQSLQTGRHKPEVKTKTTKADLHFDMAAVNWSADQIKTFFETLAREDKTLDHGLIITRWQKNIQISKDMWNVQQAETILTSAVTENLGDMADFIPVNAALMTPRGDRAKTGWLLRPSGVPPYDFVEIGLLIFGDVLGNGLNLQVYSVYLPDNGLSSGNITEINKATSNLVIAVKNEEDPDVNGFVEAGRDIILQALAGWLHTVVNQNIGSGSEDNEDDSFF